MFFFYHLKFQDMLSLINHFTHYLFIFMSLHLIRNDQFFAISQGISSNIPALKRISNNLTIATDMSHVSIREKETEKKFFTMYNTIIRTGESRALGAKYLNETRLPSNYDCLTWCLETPSCNVAVYEEKNMQSCYLFDCGPPVQCAVNSPCAVNLALCKFTAHGFFTSSILRMSQHSYELSQWGKEMQQERDTEQQSNAAFTSAVPPVDISTISASLISPTSIIQSIKKGSICHHYQFQCVNSSECIAIYNVCDGIPQCPDGSDESAELKCPIKADIPVKQIPSDLNRSLGVPHTLEIKPPVPKEIQPVPHSPSSFPRPQNVRPMAHKELQRKEDHKAGWRGPYSNSEMTKPGYHHHIDDKDPDGLGSPFIHKHSQFISANDPHVQSLNRWASDYDQYPPPHSTSLDQQYYERMEEPSYLSNQLPVDYDTPVKNYAGYHPEDLAYWPNQDDTSYTADEFPQPGMSNLNKMVGGYPDKESAYAQQMARTAAEQYPEAKLSVRKPVPIQNPPSEMDDYKMQRFSPHSRQQQVSPYLAMEESLQQRLSNSYPEIKSKSPFSPMQNVDDAMYDSDDLIRASLVNQLPKKIDLMNHPHEHDLKQLARDKLHHPSKGAIINDDLIVVKDDSFITVKPTSHTKAIQRTVLDFKMSVAELYESSSTHSHEANSAILALVVGVTVSFLLIILLVCRMKTLRRRMSRKGRGLAHDADYLVNGMYL